MKVRSTHLLLIIDLLGTGFFAAEGASAASQARLDLLGVLVLSFSTALAGGILRDLLIGDVPPPSIQDWRYAGAALLAGAVTFLLHLFGISSNYWVRLGIDALGLSFFAVAGATKALEFGLSPLLATMMGGITGVGGGTLSDLLLGRVPAVLRTDIYASAALLGAAVTLSLLRMKASMRLASVVGILACFVLRMLAVFFHWNLPRG